MRNVKQAALTGCQKRPKRSLIKYIASISPHRVANFYNPVAASESMKVTSAGNFRSVPGCKVVSLKGDDDDPSIEC